VTSAFSGRLLQQTGLKGVAPLGNGPSVRSSCTGVDRGLFAVLLGRRNKMNAHRLSPTHFESIEPHLLMLLLVISGVGVEHK
jgi:hypothetical protein